MIALLVPLVGCASTSEEPPSLTAPALVTVQAVIPAVKIGHRPIVADRVYPDRLRLGAVDAEVIPIALVGGLLVPPSDPQVLGWWGRMAGSPHGVTLIVGHSVHTGGGALNDLDAVPAGAVADLSGVKYRVVSNETMSKADLAARATDLFNQSGPPRLVVVTCEDYDPATGEWVSNAVLTAVPMGEG